MPYTFLHLAALGHLEAVERVAMGAEQAGHKVVATTELAALGVKRLPPVLMVAVGDLDVLLVAFTRLFTPSLLNVVERTAPSITLKSSEQPAKLADRPAPLVK